MTPKFSKALLCAGLAAALVGCGGGSSTTTMDGSGSMTEPTAADTAAAAIQASYEFVSGLVDALSDKSSAEQVTSVRGQVNSFLDQVRTAADLSSAKRNEFTTNGTMLLTTITTKTTPEPTPPTTPPTETEVRNTAWYDELSPNSLDALTKKWPDSNTLSGKKTPVTGLPAGWEAMDYSYSNVTTTTTTTATDEQGKTFSKNVVRPTSEIELRWDEVALEAAKSNRSSVINDYLGGSGIKIETILTGIGTTSEAFASTSPVQNVLALGTGVNATADDSINLAGSGIVYEVLTGRRLEGPDTTGTDFTAFTTGANVFTENDGDYIIKTSFHRDHFEEVDANFLEGLTSSPVAWKKDATHIEFLQTSPNPVYIKWRGIPVHVTMVTDSGSTSVITARFNKEGYLEVVPVVTSGEGILRNDRIAIVLRPVDPNNLSRIATQNIHSMPLTVREEKTKTSVMEFAYWASQNKSSPFAVRNVDTFVRQHPDMMFDDVTDMPAKLTGMAKYNGLAAGYYAIGEESHGEFTADAMLTADFGTNEVTGMIDSFMPMTGDDDLSPWKLTLNSATFMDDNTFGNAFDGTTSGQSDGGGQKGIWNGQFLGKANPGTDLESAADMTNDYPEAVVGNFTGHFAANDGHVEGAFGTELHDDYKE